MSIVETMKGIAQKEIEKLHLLELGVVTSIFPHSSATDKDNYECNVRLKSTDVELRKVPTATQCIGLVGVPRVGDLVLVGFTNGDINAPIIIGRLYNDEDRPPVNQAQEVVYVPPYERNPNVRRIYLEFPGGMTFRITDDEVDINAGETKVIVQRNGDVIIDARGDIHVRARNAAIRSRGSMSLSASTIKIESTKELNIKSGTDMKVESGASAEITSTTEMKVEATAQMRIRGATVHIN